MYSQNYPAFSNLASGVFRDAMDHLLDPLTSIEQAEALGVEVAPAFDKAAEDHGVNHETIIRALEQFILKWADVQNGESDNAAANGGTNTEDTTGSARIQNAFLRKVIEQLSAKPAS
jgi:hypothetical protein